MSYRHRRILGVLKGAHFLIPFWLDFLVFNFLYIRDPSSNPFVNTFTALFFREESEFFIKNKITLVLVTQILGFFKIL